MNYEKIVRNVIEEHKVSPVDMLNIGDRTGEYTYLSGHIDSYVRTVRDLDQLLDGDKSRRILEIGSFLGPVSVSLRQMGYDVSAVDIPEFHQSDRLRALYGRHGVDYRAANLRHHKLPYDSGAFDAVIICEVIEHFNFNPLPVILEINRILKTGGHIYVGMPNQAFIVNRIRLLQGKSTQGRIEEFFQQLDRNSNMVVGLHWREYTMAETCEMLSRMGFHLERSYFFNEGASHMANPLKAMLRAIAYAYPPFRPYQVVIAKKATLPIYEFWLTEANS
jgi:2-polyprenyl-3-methyl-5-hydroxy-6-metoxy-1,4-benzoquinol methylase